jgi:hypothetical protein
MLSVDATRIRVEEADHKNQDMELESSGGRVITRRVSRVRVSRMLRLEESMVAMYAPSGLGTEWVEAGNQESVSGTRIDLG